jgi:hypothetical protein
MPEIGQGTPHQKNAQIEIQARSKRLLSVLSGRREDPLRILLPVWRVSPDGVTAAGSASCLHRREDHMRRVIFGVCVLTAACSGNIPDSPVAPTSATGGRDATVTASRTLALRGTELPFQGTFTGTSVSCFFDATCPPGTVIITGRKTGEATELGRLTAITVAQGAFPPTGAPPTGTWDFTAANGDRLSATAVVTPDQFIPPNVQHVTVAGTISGGTGRFAAATGAFTARVVSTLNFDHTSSESGSFEGHINLNR